MFDRDKIIAEDFDFVEIGWETYSKFCGVQGWTLVNIHSRKEQDFVMYYLQQRLLFPTVKPAMGYDIFCYLGIVPF